MRESCKVVYEGTESLMVYDKKRVVFQNKNTIGSLKKGLGYIVKGTMVSKGNYAFAEIKNILGVVPDCYTSLNTFSHIGVPLAVFIGTYGDSTFVKEVVKEREIIKTFKDNGDLLIYETSTIKKPNVSERNANFHRLNELITNWMDVTSVLNERLENDIYSKEGSFDIKTSEKLLSTLRKFRYNKIFKLDSGVIVIDGVYQSLVIWGSNDNEQMVWLNGKVHLTEGTYLDISEYVGSLVK